MEERRLGKMEATFGLSLLAALLAGLGWAYVHQLDASVPATRPDPNWVSAQPKSPSDGAVQQTAYRPEWLSTEGDASPAAAR
ncbi:MAG: hypothetical protein AB7G28_15460 [Pirellulales bacterium]